MRPLLFTLKSFISRSLKIPISRNRTSAGLWFPRQTLKAQHCFWQEHQSRNKYPMLATRRVVEYFYSSTRMISGEITTRWFPGGSSLLGIQKKSPMAWSLFLKIYMGIYGICFSSMPAIHSGKEMIECIRIAWG